MNAGYGQISGAPRFLVVAGTHSGVGKTTIALGLMEAFHRRGLRVQGFKVGPDFIDPGHHTRVTGAPSLNLDGWMLSQAYNRNIFARALRDKDLGIIEGVMGLFDGYDGRSEAGSTAQMSKWLGAPVILVVDASSMARSVAALAYGFANFDKQLQVTGVIGNRVASQGHLEYLAQALESVPGIRFLGGLPAVETIQIPERHLGLVTSAENPYEIDLPARLAGLMEKHVDLDAVYSLTASAIEYKRPERYREARPIVRLGVAMDQAFCFYYQDNLDMLSRFGAELHFFSPIRDTQLPEDLDGLYLGGGYPELFAADLEKNESLRAEVLLAASRGMPVYAECGGFMYLVRSILVDGHSHAMVGLFPFRTRMLTRRQSLGYREVILREDGLLGLKGTRARGHEFHYSELMDVPQNFPTLFRVNPRRGSSALNDGYVINNTVAGYIHLHFGSNPELASNLVRRCREFRDTFGGNSNDSKSRSR